MSTKVINIQDSKPAFTQKRKSPEAVCCQHVNVIIDEENRVVECDKCGTTLSAFDYLLHCAYSEQNAFTKFNYLKKEVSKLERKHWKLQNSIKKMQEDLGVKKPENKKLYNFK